MIQDKLKGVSYNVLFVDPGLGGTGWAYFKDLENKKSKPIRGVLKKPRDKHWINVAHTLSHELYRTLLLGRRADTVVIECAETWSASAKSMASSSSKNNEPADLVKLSILVGMYIRAVFDFGGISAPILILPREWKGQLPKNIVVQRVNAYYNIRARDHEADAIGMGMAAMGVL